MSFSKMFDITSNISSSRVYAFITLISYLILGTCALGLFCFTKTISLITVDKITIITSTFNNFFAGLITIFGLCVGGATLSKFSGE
jgi:hypothetical protein